MSMPASAATVRPRRPSTGKAWPRASAKWAREPLYITSQRREMSRASSSRIKGASSCSMQVTSAALVPALQTAALASP